MNWLAHVFLSAPDVEHRLGNLLADLVRGDARQRMSERFRAGAQAHHAIDAFTDAHPVVRRSRARLSSAHRRFSGVLVDVFYDYCLAARWDRYSTVGLDAFTARFYADVLATPVALPTDAAATLARIVRHDLLGQYREADGVRSSLLRLSRYLQQRWRRPFALEDSVAELLEHEAEFVRDFDEFFPQLQNAQARGAARPVYGENRD